MMMKNLYSTLLLLGLIGIALTLPAPEIDRKKCQTRNGLFKVPGSFCRKFYKCTNWIPVEKICPPDQHFHPLRQRCDWEELYPCLEKPTRKECPRPNGNFLKPGTQCKIYYSCCDGRPTEKKCPGDTLFDPDKEKCEWPELYNCVESTSPTPTDLVTSSTTLATPEDTSTFDITDSTSISTLASSTVTSTLEEVSTVEEISSSPTAIPTTLSTPEDTPTFDITDSTSSILASSTVTNTPEEVSIVEEISSSSTIIPKTFSTPEDTPTVDDPQTSTTTKKILPGTSTVYSTSTETSIFSSTEEILTKTEPNIHSSSIEASISDFPITNSEMTTMETVVLTSTKSHSTTDGDVSESTSTSQPTKKISLTPLTSSTPTNKETSTQSTSSPGIEDFVCPERSGYFPHPTDRHKFIGCVDWQPQIMNCPSNLVYDHKARACVYNRKKADRLSKN